MMLAHPAWGFEITFQENTFNSVVIENEDAFFSFISEFVSQADGEMGNFVLSDDEKQLDIKKHVEIITDMFRLDFNKKKLLSGLYKSLIEKTKHEEMYEETMQLLTHIRQYLTILCEQEECLINTSTDQIDLTGLFKEAGIKFESVESLPERLLNYIIALREYCNMKLFVFVDIRASIGKQGWNEFLKELAYEKMNVLFFESVEHETLENERQFIIDKDLCEIFSD